MQTLTQYAWPGNVRELRNLVENLMIFAKDGCPLTRDQLPAHVFSRTDKNRRITIPFGTTMAELEKEAIYQTLEAVSGNKTRAAEVLQVGLRTLQRKLKDYESGTDSGEDTDGD